MITGATKNKVDAIWQRMWEGGIANPTDVISQLTYLMFIRQLDDRDLDAERMEGLTGIEQPRIFPQTETGRRMRWHVFKDYGAEQMHAIVEGEVFPFIKTLSDGSAFARYMATATFGISSPVTLQRAVTGIDELMNDYVNDIADLGDLYEYMLSKLSVSGQNGQFRTPQHIRKMMVELVDPKPGELICDPACGTAGFLISASEHIRAHHEPTMTAEEWDLFSGNVDEGKPVQFTGFDTDQTMLRYSAMNLMLHDINRPDIRYQDSVSKSNTIQDRFDLVLANPPFTGSVDVEGIDDSLRTICDSRATELLFVALFIRMLRIGGRCACIVPNGVLFRTNSKAYRQLRKEIVDHQRLEAIIYMPSGVFKPYSGVSTAVLVFTKTNAGGTDDVWLYNMEGDGFTLDDKRDADAAHDDIPDILERWNRLDAERERSRTDKSFLVPAQEIRDNDYDFSFNKYTETVYERIEYPPTEEILADLEDINQRITHGLTELKAMLGGSDRR